MASVAERGGGAPFFWFVAGEESGDARAAEVMEAMSRLRPGVRFCGAGGGRMARLCGEGFDQWVDTAAVTGLWDVLRNYGYFRSKFHAMLAAVRVASPDAVVLVDYPGFNLRFAKALRASGFSGRILYFISPQVWAWNRGRIPRMARFLDLMVCVFPFEAPMYEASGLRTVFVGHPMLEALGKAGSCEAREEGLLGLFPGSRDREVKRIFPAMVEAARIVRQRMPGVRIEAAAAGPRREALMRRIAEGSPVEVRCGNAHSLMQRATAGLVCSGTATLEAASFGLPYALVYKTAWLTYEVGRRLVDVDALGIINILNNHRVNPPAVAGGDPLPAPHLVREFIQGGATPVALADEATRLLGDSDARDRLVRELGEVVSMLRAEGAAERAAEVLLAGVDG
jgi:lipid-A-disaccharide synthase